MRIIDELTNQEITNPDLSVGVLFETLWASPEAYATIDDKTKFALSDDDYEQVQLYHVYTEAELEQQALDKERNARSELMNALPDAVADLSDLVSSDTTDMQVVMDALADLSETVSELAAKEVSNG